jgi:hypothetical protein
MESTTFRYSCHGRWRARQFKRAGYTLQRFLRLALQVFNLYRFYFFRWPFAKLPSLVCRAGTMYEYLVIGDHITNHTRQKSIMYIISTTCILPMTHVACQGKLERRNAFPNDRYWMPVPPETVASLWLPP